MDHVSRRTLLNREQLESRLGVDLERPPILVLYHPVMMARDTLEEVDALFSALAAVQEQILFCYPNADAGSRALIERTESFLARIDRGRMFTNLDAVTYWSLLARVELLIGNSSSGIMEAASFPVPAVNIGLRQQGRERARNVLDAAPEARSILDAIGRARSTEFRRSLAGMENPYGEGCASEKIVRVLSTIPLSRELLMERHASAPIPIEPRESAPTS